MKKFIHRKERGERPENRERSFNTNKKNRDFSDFSHNDSAPKRERSSSFGENNEKRPYKKSFSDHKGEGKPFKKSYSSDGSSSYPPKKRTFRSEDSSGKSYNKPFNSRRNDTSFGDKEHPLNRPIKDAYKGEERGEKRSFSKKFGSSSKPYEGSKDRPFSKSSDRPYYKKDREGFDKSGDRPFKSDRPFSKSGDRPYYKKDREGFDKSGDRPFKSDRPFSKSSDRPYYKKDREGFDKSGDRPFKSDRPFSKSGDRPYYKKDREGFDKSGDRPFKSDRPFSKSGDRPYYKKDREGFDKSFDKSTDRPFSKSSDRPYEKSFDKKERDRGIPFKEDNPFSKFRKRNESSESNNRFENRRFDKGADRNDRGGKKQYGSDKPFNSQPEYDMDRIQSKLNKKKDSKPNEEIRLNRYIANSGVCSRREADELISSGKVMVNGVVVTELGTIVKRNDKVEYKGKQLIPEKMVYVLLNKPKDFITTMDDPEQRKTVMSLVEEACEERIYPVGRLDRNTSGLLLLTNDGDLTKLLSHPSSEVKKLYDVSIDKPLTKDHEAQICASDFSLEDGLVQLDSFEIISPDRKHFGISIHSGKNRIVRRIFEKFGYNIEKLDRVMYAGLTKKDLPRGEWRYLSEQEVVFLKNFSAKKKKVSESKELEGKIKWEDFED
jgi:23S rRNA pseudouridine2605 synthase